MWSRGGSHDDRTCSKAMVDADLMVLMVEPDCVGWNDDGATAWGLLGVEPREGACIGSGDATRLMGVEERGGESSTP